MQHRDPGALDAVHCKEHMQAPYPAGEATLATGPPPEPAHTICCSICGGAPLKTRGCRHLFHGRRRTHEEDWLVVQLPPAAGSVGGLPSRPDIRVITYNYKGQRGGRVTEHTPRSPGGGRYRATPREREWVWRRSPSCELGVGPQPKHTQSAAFMNLRLPPLRHALMRQMSGILQGAQADERR